MVQWWQNDPMVAKCLNLSTQETEAEALPQVPRHLGHDETL